MINIHKLGEYETIHYFMPGKTLDDISLKKLHSSLVKVNEQSEANVVNKMLNKNLSLDEIRHYLRDTIIGLFQKQNDVHAFIISPILKCKNKSILHAGLIIIKKNPGANLMGFLGISNFIMGYEKFGSIYTTNISSTPSSIENFSKVVPGSWPGPDAKLKTSPKGFREIVKILKEDYMDKNFPDPEKLNVDYKRFVLTSNSKEMGFKTDFHKVSRADNFKYNLFCHAWIDYGKEEDIIQVGEITFWKYLRMRFLSFNLKIALRNISAKNDCHEQSRVANNHEEKKAA